jgi:hypothetical protein
VDYKGMPTPHFTFRLPLEEQQKIQEVARVYGSPNASAFVREMVISIVNGGAGTHAFLLKLGEKLSGQLQLEMEAAVQRRAAKLARRRPKQRKPGRKRDRTT